jgi:hypothetical protein
MEQGYTPKGYVTRVVGGKPVTIPVSRLKIIPPKGGTAAVTPKAACPCGRCGKWR